MSIPKTTFFYVFCGALYIIGRNAPHILCRVYIAQHVPCIFVHVCHLCMCRVCCIIITSQAPKEASMIQYIKVVKDENNKTTSYYVTDKKTYTINGTGTPKAIYNEVMQFYMMHRGQMIDENTIIWK